MISPYNGHSSVGKLRYNLPQSISPYVGNYDATKFGLACPQQAITIPAVPDLASPVVDFIANSIYGRVFPDSEDCKLKRRVRFQFKAPDHSIRSHPERNKTGACWTKFEVACGCGKGLSDLVRLCTQFLCSGFLAVRCSIKKWHDGPYSYICFRRLRTWKSSHVGLLFETPQLNIDASFESGTTVAVLLPAQLQWGNPSST